MTKRSSIAKFSLMIGMSMLAVVLSVASPAAATVPGNNVLASVNTGGSVGGNNHSGWSNFGTGSILSKNGKFVAFNSKASDLVSSDTNAKQDVFVRNLSQNTTTRVSVSSSSMQSDNDSEITAVSETGRYVAFRSTATNLIDGQTKSGTNAYIFDTKTATVSLVGSGTSTTITGISSDGAYALKETVNSNNHIYLLNVATSAETQLDVPTSGGQQAVDSLHSVMSCDGAFVAFESTATNFVSGDTNGKKDIFLVDLRNGLKTTDITISADDDSMTPTLSCNGNYVGFTSRSTTFASGISSSAYNGHYYRYDRVDDSYVLLDRLSSGDIATATATSYSGPSLQLSDTGNALFKHPLNLETGLGASELFVRNVNSGTTDLLSRDESGNASSMGVYSAFISSDGKWATYVAQHSSGIFSSTTDDYDNIAVAETGL